LCKWRLWIRSVGYSHASFHRIEWRSWWIGFGGLPNLIIIFTKAMNRHQITTTDLHEYVGKEVVVINDDTQAEEKIILKGWKEGKISGVRPKTKILVEYYPPVKMFAKA
jgi:hypothetical protein